MVRGNIRVRFPVLRTRGRTIVSGGKILKGKGTKGEKEKKGREEGGISFLIQ